eukprot:g20360.t1
MWFWYSGKGNLTILHCNIVKKQCNTGVDTWDQCAGGAAMWPAETIFGKSQPSLCLHITFFWYKGCVWGLFQTLGVPRREGWSMMDAAMLQEVTSRLQRVPKQTGTLVADHSGKILFASGQLQSGTAGSIFRRLLMHVEGVLSLQHKSTGKRPELQRVTVAFQNYQYVLTVTEHMVVVVKKN